MPSSSHFSTSVLPRAKRAALLFLFTTARLGAVHTPCGGGPPSGPAIESTSITPMPSCRVTPEAAPTLIEAPPAAGFRAGQGPDRTAATPKTAKPSWSGAPQSTEMPSHAATETLIC